MPYRNRLNGVSLNSETVKELFHYDPITGILYRKMISGIKRVGTPKALRGHLIVAYQGKTYPVTHIIWLFMRGRFPYDIVEHADLNPQNNAWDNLRAGDQSDNMANIRVTTRSQSGVKGVVWDGVRGKWAAYIGYNYKTYNLGRYDSIEEAKTAYDQKAQELFGEFARS